jgi:hypothetical protein
MGFLAMDSLLAKGVARFQKIQLNRFKRQMYK